MENLIPNKRNMITIRTLAMAFLTACLFSCASSQQPTPRQVGGPCEGCEAVLEYGDQALTPSDTLADFGKGGRKIKVE
jgi:protocatechuate 3,4-dioxygenase beta subunit